MSKSKLAQRMALLVVVAPFIDKKSGKRINPGDPLPTSMTEERLDVLQRTGCVKAGQTESGGRKKGKGEAAKGAAAGPGLFPGGEGEGQQSGTGPDRGTGPEGGGEGEGQQSGTGPDPGTGTEGGGEAEDPQAGTGTDTEAVAGADGGDSGAGAEPDGAGRDEGDEQSQDNSGR